MRVGEREGVEGDDLRDGDGEPRERNAERNPGPAPQGGCNRDERNRGPDRSDDDVACPEMPDLEDRERRGVGRGGACE